MNNIIEIKPGAIYFSQFICTCCFMNNICFTEGQITVLAKIQVQVQRQKCKDLIEQKYGAWQSTLVVKHTLGQWKEKFKFLP